jgi:hypothetical protein
MHQLKRTIIAIMKPSAVVCFAIPKKINATEALEIAKKDIAKKIILRIFVILKAVSTLVCSYK